MVREMGAVTQHKLAQLRTPIRRLAVYLPGEACGLWKDARRKGIRRGGQGAIHRCEFLPTGS